MIIEELDLDNLLYLRDTAITALSSEIFDDDTEFQELYIKCDRQINIIKNLKK